MCITERAKQVLEDRQTRIRDFSKLQPDHPFAIANKQAIEASEQNTWNATGLLSVTGVVWWALNLTLDLAYPNVIMFNATGGPDFDFAVFTADVTGSFVVDPSTLSGEMQFSLQGEAVGTGEVSIDLYINNWNTWVGSFAGIVLGVSLIPSLNGEGTCTYNP
jgi:hypothetical protein